MSSTSNKAEEEPARGPQQPSEPATGSAPTEDDYFRTLENISVIQHAALKGAKEAAEHLVKIALFATHAINLLGEFETRWEQARPLSERIAMLKGIKDQKDEWPVIENTVRHGRSDDLRWHLDRILSLFRLVRRTGQTDKEPSFALKARTLPPESTAPNVVEEWAEAIADYMISVESHDLSKLGKFTNARSLMKKHQKRITKRASKLKEEGDPKLDLRAEMRDFKSKKRTSPSPAEWKESLKKTIQSRLAVIFLSPPN